MARLLALAHIGAGEHHATVAKPDMGNLHRDRHAANQHDLMAPVELVCLARRIIERHIGICRDRPTGLRPGLGIASDSIVTARIAKGANLLVNADQCQPFPRRLALIGPKEPVNMLNPRPDPWQRLVFALIGEISLARPQDLAHPSAIARTNGAMASMRDTCSSRVIFFIDQPCAWKARRTRAIVSTVFNSRSIRCPKANGQTKPEGGQNRAPITPP